MGDQELRESLARMPAASRDALRRTLIADVAYRDAMADRLLRSGGQGMADLLDLLTLHPEMRRQAVRVLGELETGDKG